MCTCNMCVCVRVDVFDLSLGFGLIEVAHETLKELVER